MEDLYADHPIVLQYRLRAYRDLRGTCGQYRQAYPHRILRFHEIRPRNIERHVIVRSAERGQFRRGIALHYSIRFRVPRPNVVRGVVVRPLPLEMVFNSKSFCLKAHVSII